MAQRTPIRSILSVVPSTQTSTEGMPKKEQPSERGASRARNASERQPPRQRRQTKPNTQQPQQKQQFNKKIAQEPILPLQSRQRLSAETPINRMVNGLPLPRQTAVETYKILEWQRYRERGRKQSAFERNPQSDRGNIVNNLNVPSSTRQQRIRRAKQQKKAISPLIYGARILILGVGIGVIAGTLLSIFDPASRMPKKNSQLEATELQKTSNSFAQQNLQMTSEIEPLKKQLQELAAQHSDLTAAAIFVDVDTGAYTELNSNLSLAAASTIKVPILIAFFQDVDAGKIRLDEMLKMEAEDIAQGSGEMQYQPPGKLYSAIEVATLMITNSDNTATNMLIKRLGGATILNQRFKSWGLNKTAIRNLLPDLEGTNTTSVRDMGNLLAQIHQGKLISLRSRDRIFEIMRRTVNKSLLPQGIDKSATIAHKTGDIGTSIADVGIIDLPNGKRYLAAAIVKRPHNDARAEELIRQFSQKAYQFFSQASN